MAYAALGSNLDDPEFQVRNALDALSRLPQTRLARHSRLYRTAPWGIKEQPDFVNAVAELETSLDPAALLAAFHRIEAAAGRCRDGTRNGPRILDLDLLLYADRVGVFGAAELPHPRLHERAFVLLPLAELAPALIVPGRGVVVDLLARVSVEGCVPIL